MPTTTEVIPTCYALALARPHALHQPTQLWSQLLPIYRHDNDAVRGFPGSSVQPKPEISLAQTCRKCTASKTEITAQMIDQQLGLSHPTGLYKKAPPPASERQTSSSSYPQAHLEVRGNTRSAWSRKLKQL